MIKNFNPKPFEGGNPLPDYVSNVSRYELVGIVPGGYHVTLAKLAVGSSISAGNPLSHALFESVEFFPMLPCSEEDVLWSLGDWFMVQNPDISEVSVVVSQTCH